MSLHGNHRRWQGVKVLPVYVWASDCVGECDGMLLPWLFQHHFWVWKLSAPCARWWGRCSARSVVIETKPALFWPLFFYFDFFSFLHARTPQAGSLLTHRPSCLHLHHSSSILLFLLCSSYSAPLWVTCFPANIYHISSWAGWVFKWTNETEWCIIYAAIIHRPDAGGADVICVGVCAWKA